mgnify:CR=1 FL=1
MTERAAYERLEDELSAWIGEPHVHVVACSSGTAALHLALEAMRLPLGSSVVTGEFSMIAVPRAIVMAGHKPVFTDCNDALLMKKYFTIGPADAAVVVHIYGRKCEHITSMTVIEDMAEVHGVKPQSSSFAATYSFYRNKIVNGAEGGAVAFRDPDAAAHARSLRSLGFTEDHDFRHLERGFNARLSNEHAELIRASLANVDENLEKRAQVAAWYDKAVPIDWRMPPRDVDWVYDLRIRSEGFDNASVVRTLNNQGIQARLAFKPMSMQAEFFDPSYEQLNAYRMSREVLYLPVYPDMTESEVGVNVNALKDAVAIGHRSTA